MKVTAVCAAPVLPLRWRSSECTPLNLGILRMQPAAGDRVTPGSPPPQAADSGHGKRGRSADADGEQGSEPRAKKAKPAGEQQCALS